MIKNQWTKVNGIPVFINNRGKYIAVNKDHLPSLKAATKEMLIDSLHRTKVTKEKIIEFLGTI